MQRRKLAGAASASGPWVIKLCSYKSADGSTICIAAYPCAKHNHIRCECGRQAIAHCGSSGIIHGLILCGKPICSRDDQWCSAHRHEAGTMGYIGAPGKPMHGKGELQRFIPDSPSFKHRFIAWLRNFYPAQLKAEIFWREEKLNHPPPEPLPTFTLQIGHRYFDCAGDNVIERFFVYPLEG